MAITYSGGSLVETLAGQESLGYGIGSDALFGRSPMAAAPDGIEYFADSDGFIYVSEVSSHRIRRIDPATAIVLTVSGTGAPGFVDGTTSAQFDSPGLLVADGSGRLYVADRGNRQMRLIQLQTGAVSTVALIS